MRLIMFYWDNCTSCEAMKEQFDKVDIPKNKIHAHKEVSFSLEYWVRWIPCFILEWKYWAEVKRAYWIIGLDKWLKDWLDTISSKEPSEEQT